MPRSLLFSVGLLIVTVGSWKGPIAISRAEDGKPAAVRHYRAKELIGTAVSIDGGASAGIIDDIVLDETGDVSYLLVVSPDKRLVTIPWGATLFDLKKRSAVVPITQEHFRRIPTYARGDYPEFSSPTYRTQIDQYYGKTAGGRRIIKRGNPGIVK